MWLNFIEISISLLDHYIYILGLLDMGRVYAIIAAFILYPNLDAMRKVPELNQIDLIKGTNLEKQRFIDLKAED